MRKRILQRAEHLDVLTLCQIARIAVHEDARTRNPPPGVARRCGGAGDRAPSSASDHRLRETRASNIDDKQTCCSFADDR